VNVIGVGIDLVDVGRIERVLERRPRFAERVFSDEERAYCERSPTVRATCYAARWAAREACVKALGGVPGGWRWHDIRVVRRRGGAPEMELDGPARMRARAIGAERVLVSFSHERDAAVAMCVALGGDAR
jgi:holo-[acyl-carrier protein] synthase